MMEHLDPDIAIYLDNRAVFCILCDHCFPAQIGMGRVMSRRTGLTRPVLWVSALYVRAITPLLMSVVKQLFVNAGAAEI
jgi:hypothetical protein